MDDPKPRRAPLEWIEALERGEADAAAGRGRDAEEFLKELEAEDEAVLADIAARKRPSPAA
jgi:hypothetical protein